MPRVKPRKKRWVRLTPDLVRRRREIRAVLRKARVLSDSFRKRLKKIKSKRRQELARLKAELKAIIPAEVVEEIRSVSSAEYRLRRIKLGERFIARRYRTRGGGEAFRFYDTVKKRFISKSNINRIEKLERYYAEVRRVQRLAGISWAEARRFVSIYRVRVVPLLKERRRVRRRLKILTNKPGDLNKKETTEFNMLREYRDLLDYLVGRLSLWGEEIS